MRAVQKPVYARKHGGKVLHEIARVGEGGIASRCGLRYPKKAWTPLRQGRPRRELCKRCLWTRPGKSKERA